MSQVIEIDDSYELEEPEYLVERRSSQNQLLRRYMEEDWSYYRHIAEHRRRRTAVGNILRIYDEAVLRIGGAWQVLRGNARARPLRLDGI